MKCQNAVQSCSNSHYVGYWKMERYQSSLLLISLKLNNSDGVFEVWKLITLLVVWQDSCVYDSQLVHRNFWIFRVEYEGWRGSCLFFTTMYHYYSSIHHLGALQFSSPSFRKHTCWENMIGSYNRRLPSTERTQFQLKKQLNNFTDPK